MDSRFRGNDGWCVAAVYIRSNDYGLVKAAWGDENWVVLHGWQPDGRGRGKAGLKPALRVAHRLWGLRLESLWPWGGCKGV